MELSYAFSDSIQVIVIAFGLVDIPPSGLFNMTLHFPLAERGTATFPEILEGGEMPVTEIGIVDPP